MPLVPLLEHKNADFVLEKPENKGSRPQKRTKTSILCSKSLKTGGSNPQKHKNPDFVLETPENGGSRPQKSTKTSILCSKSPKTRVPNPKSAQKPRFCARKEWQEGLGVAAGQRKEHREAEK